VNNACPRLVFRSASFPACSVSCSRGNPNSPSAPPSDAPGEKSTGTSKSTAGVDAAYRIPPPPQRGRQRASHGKSPRARIPPGAHGTEYVSSSLSKNYRLPRPAQVTGHRPPCPLINIQVLRPKRPHVNPSDNKSMNRPPPPLSRQTRRHANERAST